MNGAALAIDDESVYWIVNLPTSYLLRSSKEPGGATEYLATSSERINAVFVSEGWIYWQDMASVRRMPTGTLGVVDPALAGSVPHEVVVSIAWCQAQDRYPIAARAQAGSLFSLMRPSDASTAGEAFDLTGGAPTALGGGVGLTFSNDRPVAIDTERIYGVANVLPPGGWPPTPTELVAFPRSGGAATTLFSGLGRGDAVAVGGGFIFVNDAGDEMADRPGRILRLRK